MKPVLWTESSLSAATGGAPQGRAFEATGVSIDSRTVEPGDLFIALRGDSHDGHAHVAAALAAGAAAALVEDAPTGLAAGAPLVAVPDTMAALVALGHAARARFGGRVIGVTGSVGKTGSKEALRTILSRQAATDASVGSYNNHFGVPLTLARCPADARFLVAEMGMNHAGEMRGLSMIARPHVALITTIEAVHVEFFASLDAVADAKAEIFEGMGADSHAVLNRDNGQYDRLAAAARAAGVANVWSFGERAGTEARLLEAVLMPGASKVVAEILGRRIAYELPLPGRHWVQNSLGLLLAAAAAGADVERAAGDLVHVAPADGRGTRARIRLPGGGVFTLIDETYNASPAAMKATIAVLGRAEIPAGGRRIAVLGDMLELGAAGPDLHAGLAGPIQAAGIDAVHSCGPLTANLHEALPANRRGLHAADSGALAPLVAGAVRPGDVVMVKGSKGSKMGLVVEALKALGQPMLEERGAA